MLFLSQHLDAKVLHHGVLQAAYGALLGKELRGWVEGYSAEFGGDVCRWGDLGVCRVQANA
jgi:hypothetical protein